MAAQVLPTFLPFAIDDQDTLGICWPKWFSRFENLLLALNITDEARKKAMLLYYLGEPALDIYETLPDTGDAKDYKKAHEALTTYFVPKKNTSVETFKFRNAKQQVTESIDQYHTRCRNSQNTVNLLTLRKKLKLKLTSGQHKKNYVDMHFVLQIFPSLTCSNMAALLNLLKKML